MRGDSNVEPVGRRAVDQSNGDGTRPVTDAYIPRGRLTGSADGGSTKDASLQSASHILEAFRATGYGSSQRCFNEGYIVENELAWRLTEESCDQIDSSWILALQPLHKNP